LTVIVGLDANLRVVGEARDGNEAVSQAQRLQPDVILIRAGRPL
jgi:chemotaxis response regulator CheB